MAETEVRAATVDDAQAIASVHVRSWQSAYRGLIDEERLDDVDEVARTADWRRSIESGQGHVLVSLVDDEVVGFAACLASRDDDSRSDCGEVSAIYLVPGAWGRGVGRVLMNQALAGLAAAGFAQVTLWVLVGNERAIRFYERCGFQPDGAAKTDRSRGEPLREVRYRRTLAGA